MTSTTLCRFAQLGGMLAWLAASVAQAQVGDSATHDRIVAYFRAIRSGVMPAGDTLVTWRADGPILYHTSRRVGSSMQTGMFRNDALIGTASVEWGASGPIAFSVRWLGDSPLMLSGRIEATEMVITGSRSTRVTVPAGLWAVADYGMDDLLLPLIPSLRETPQAVAVFRPFAQKWDTLSVSVTKHGAFDVLTTADGKGARMWCATDARRQSCLWIQESDSVAERRPLDNTPAFAAYAAARRALRKLP